MSAATTHHSGTAPYYFVPSPSRHPVLVATAMLLVIFGAGQWVNGAPWGKWFVFGGLALWAVIMFQFTLFLVIGAILYVYYQDANLPPPHPPDRIYPQFIWNHLPPGVSGLVIAAILAMAQFATIPRFTFGREQRASAA